MRIYAIRLLAVTMAILAIFLAGAAITLHQMYPMRLTSAKSEDERRWIKEEESRRKAGLIREEIGFLVAAGLDVGDIILLIAWDRRRVLSSHRPGLDN